MSRDKLIGLDHWLTTEPDDWPDTAPEWTEDDEPLERSEEEICADIYNQAVAEDCAGDQQQWEHEMATTRLDKRAAHLKPGGDQGRVVRRSPLGTLLRHLGMPPMRLVGIPSHKTDCVKPLNIMGSNYHGRISP